MSGLNVDDIDELLDSKADLCVIVARSIRVCMFDYGEMKNDDLARQYGCTSAYISDMKNHGTSSLKGIKKFAKIFDMNLNEFLKMGVDNE